MQHYIVCITTKNFNLIYESEVAMLKINKPENKKLFKAAPGLLKACKEALRSFRVIYDEIDDEDKLAKLDCWPLAQLREAINQAEK